MEVFIGWALGMLTAFLIISIHDYIEAKRGGKG